MKKNSTEDYIHNRATSKRSQYKYWKLRRVSGAMRLFERLLIGINISDRLGGDGSTIKHIQEIQDHFTGTWTVNESEQFENHAINGIVLSNVSVEISSGLIKLRNGYILDDFLPHWQNLIYGGGLASEYKTAGKNSKSLKGLWTSVSNTPYYYHFVIEDLARIALVRKEYPDIKVAILKDLEPWKYELLDYFKFNYEIVDDRSIYFECYITSKTGNSQNLPGIRILRNLISESSNQNSGLKILISRKGLDREDETIENLLREKLAKRDFVELHPEKLSIRDQIEIFSKAKIIIGMHGGALTNVIWSKPDTQIIEIQSHPYRTRDFEYLANKLGLEYHLISNHLGLEEITTRVNEIE